MSVTGNTARNMRQSCRSGLSHPKTHSITRPTLAIPRDHLSVVSSFVVTPTYTSCRNIVPVHSPLQGGLLQVNFGQLKGGLRLQRPFCFEDNITSQGTYNFRVPAM